MAENSKISWCHHTFNGWIGCTKVSEGCTHCYAERDDKRRKWTPDGWGPGKKRKRTSEDNWKKPLKWDEEAAAAGIRARVFAHSLSDVFDQEVPDRWRHDLLNLASRTDHLDWMLLTKRAKEMRDFFLKFGPPPRNVWPGVSAEDQPTADERIPYLREIPADIIWVSSEPLLGPIDFGKHFTSSEAYPGSSRFHGRVNWVIVGGESGGGARPMHPGWAELIRDQCVSAGVAFHMKQWGEWLPKLPEGRERCQFVLPDGSTQPEGAAFMNDVKAGAVSMVRVGKKAAGRRLDGKVWDEFPVTNH